MNEVKGKGYHQSKQVLKRSIEEPEHAWRTRSRTYRWTAGWWWRCRGRGRPGWRRRSGRWGGRKPRRQRPRPWRATGRSRWSKPCGWRPTEAAGSPASPGTGASPPAPPPRPSSCKAAPTFSASLLLLLLLLRCSFLGGVRGRRKARERRWASFCGGLAAAWLLGLARNGVWRLPGRGVVTWRWWLERRAKERRFLMGRATVQRNNGCGGSWSTGVGSDPSTRGGVQSVIFSRRLRLVKKTYRYRLRIR